MVFEDFEQKDSVVIAYTGEGKGKTSASLGLLIRALGHDWRCAYVQFIKHWEVGEHKFFEKLSELYGDEFTFYKGGKGFFNAGELSAKEVSDEEHKQAADDTFAFARNAVLSGEYDLVICDEINNAVQDGLLDKERLKELLTRKHSSTSICVTGRDFPHDYIEFTDIATEMKKLKHHFDDKYLANKGIDF